VIPCWDFLCRLAVVHILFLITLAGHWRHGRFSSQFRLFPCLSLFSVEVPLSGFTGFTLSSILPQSWFSGSALLLGFQNPVGRKRTKLVEAIELLLQEDGELMCSADWVFVRSIFDAKPGNFVQRAEKDEKT
jgi:hypothetical protein